MSGERVFIGIVNAIVSIYVPVDVEFGFISHDYKIDKVRIAKHFIEKPTTESQPVFHIVIRKLVNQLQFIWVILYSLR